MQRATRMFLGRSSPPVHTTDDQFLPTHTITFTAVPRHQLRELLDIRGQWQGGTLFGTLMGGTLTVRTITPLGPPGWFGQPLAPSIPYLLGWSDSLAIQYGDTTDWYGNWIAAPDGRLPDERADLSWLHLGARQGFFDEFHTLVIVGITEGYLSGRAYSWGEHGPQQVSCSFKHGIPKSDDL